MNCCNMRQVLLIGKRIGKLQYRKRYELLQPSNSIGNRENFLYVTIPQAVWTVATDEKGSSELSLAIPLQYRKRYELLQHVKLSFNYATSNDSYNTASGMSCCNNIDICDTEFAYLVVTIPQAVWAVATVTHLCWNILVLRSYNTASGMSCCNLCHYTPSLL